MLAPPPTTPSSTCFVPPHPFVSARWARPSVSHPLRRPRSPSHVRPVWSDCDSWTGTSTSTSTAVSLSRRPTATALDTTTSDPSSSSSSFSSASTSVSTSPSPSPPPPYTMHDWTFKSFRVQYATAGTVGQEDEVRQRPPVVLVHGFGANCQHWRYNMGPLAARGYRVYAMDLLGFGMGDKPVPGTVDGDGGVVQYTFDYWVLQLRAFLDEVVFRDGSGDGDEGGTAAAAATRRVFLVANSIGCMVTMQAAVEAEDSVAALAFISPSLRQLNVRKRSWLQNVTAPLLMRILKYRPIGEFFLDALSRPDALRRVLGNAYTPYTASAIDDALIDLLANPAATPGALDVFLAFISYDTGPIPEDFLPRLTQPTLVLWGEEDRFEPFHLGQNLRHYSIVHRFVALPRTGHCAHDERPDECNRIIGDFLDAHRDRIEAADDSSES